MSDAHRRKKQPELIRQELLAVAARLAHERGVGALTLDAVSNASSVSKGGLLHHFPTKNALMDALLDELLSKFDVAIDQEMRGDALPRGRFSRAYLKAVAGLRDKPGEMDDWAQATLALLADPRLCKRWSDWLDERQQRHIGTDLGVGLEIVRLAADGLWLSEATQSNQHRSEEERRALLHRLIEMTQA